VTSPPASSSFYHIWAELQREPAEQAASPYMGMSGVSSHVTPTAY